MLILASDTSTKKAHFALLEDETVRAEISADTEKKHGETIIPAIEDLLFTVTKKIEEIDLFVTTVGPGSFTGIRVGLSTLKGIAFALEKPLVGVSTLETLAMNVPDSSAMVCPMIDAKRGEVYTALYEFKREGPIPEKVGEERAVAPETFLAELKDEVIFLGDGAVRYEELIRTMLPKHSSLAPQSRNDVKAGVAGILGLYAFRRGNYGDAALLKPRYLRQSYAELKR